MLKYKDLKWLLDASNALDNNDDVRDFVLLCAQNHPDLFSRLVERIQSGNFDVQPMELAIQKSSAPPVLPLAVSAQPARQFYVQGGVAADLTKDQYDLLCTYSGTQRIAAASALQRFLPHITVQEADSWVKELPNMRS